MSTKLFVLVSHKVQPRRYHSNGAACGLKVEMAPAALENAQAFVAAIRRHMELCEIAVEEELRRLAAIDGEIRPNVTSTIDDHEVNGRAAGPPNHSAPPSRRFDPPPVAPPPCPAEDFNEYSTDDGQAEAEAAEDAPADGRQLFGWARKQPSDMKGWIITYGKKNKFQGNVIDWNESQVARAYAAAKKALGDARAKAR